MKRLLACCSLLALSACAPKEPDVRSALDSITTGELLSRIKVLSSDEFEGRAPGSKGEDLTVNYLTAELQKIGLKPGNPDGTYIQKVPLAGIQSDTTTDITVKGKKLALASKVDYITFSHRYEPQVSVKDSPIVFV